MIAFYFNNRIFRILFHLPDFSCSNAELLCFVKRYHFYHTGRVCQWKEYLESIKCGCFCDIFWSSLEVYANKISDKHFPMQVNGRGNCIQKFVLLIGFTEMTRLFYFDSGHRRYIICHIHKYFRFLPVSLSLFFFVLLISIFVLFSQLFTSDLIFCPYISIFFRLEI